MKFNKKYISLFLILSITILTCGVLTAADTDNIADVSSDIISDTPEQVNPDDNIENINDNTKSITKDEKSIKKDNRYTYFNYYADSEHTQEYTNNDLYTTVGKEETLYITVENSMSSSSPLTSVGNITVSYGDKLLGQATNPGSGTQPITFSFDAVGTYELTVRFISTGYFDGSQTFTVYVEGSDVEKNTSITLNTESTAVDINETFNLNVAIEPKNATGTISIYANDYLLGQMETKSNDFGVNMALPYAGTYDFTANYTSNNTNLFEDSHTADVTTIVINPIDTVITANPVTINSENKKASINLKDTKENPVVNQNVEALIYDNDNNLVHNITSSLTDENGNVDIDIPALLEVGTYKLVINYNGGQWKTKKINEFTTADDLIHENSTAQTTLTVEELLPVEKNTTISLSTDKNIMDINETMKINIGLNPKNATGIITIYVDESQIEQLETKSNDFGVNFALPYAGDYNITAKYTSNDTELFEDSQSENLSISITPINTIITLDEVEVQKGQTKTITVILKDANSNAVVNQNMDAIIYDEDNNIILNITTNATDSEGNVDLTIPDTLEENTYNLIINYNGGQWKTKKVSEYTTADDLIHQNSTAQTTITVKQDKIPTKIELLADNIKIKDSETKTVTINTNPEVTQGIVTVKKSSEIIATVNLSTQNTFSITDNLPSYYYPYNLVLSYDDEEGDYIADNITVKVEKKANNKNTYFNYYADSAHETEYNTNSLDTIVSQEESLYITVENSYSSSSPITSAGNITVSYNGEIIDKFTNPNSGNHEVKIQFNQTGSYELTVEFEDEGNYFASEAIFTVNVYDKLPTKIQMQTDDIKIMEGQTKTVIINTNPGVQKGIVTVKKSNDVIKTVDLSVSNTFDVVYNSSYYYPITLTLSYTDDTNEYKADDITMKVEKKTYNQRTYFNYYADSAHETEYSTNSLNTTTGKTESLYITVENSYSSVSPLTTEGNITITCNDELIDKFTNPNSGSHEVLFSFDKKGEYNLTVEFETQSGYYDGIQNFTVYVEESKVTTPITLIIDDITGEYTKTKTVTVNTDPEVNQGIVTVKKEDDIIATVDLATSNTFDIIFDSLATESYQLTVSYYDENEDYNASDITVNVNVVDTRVQTQITMDDVKGLKNTDISITAKVTDADSNNINGGTVVFTDANGDMLGQSIVTNGVATLTISFTEEVNTQITATYTSEDVLILTSNATASLIISNKYQTKIILDEFSLTKSANNNITVKVVDENNNAVTNGKVTFKINGKTVKYTNGKVIYVKVENGTATLKDYQIPDNLADKEVLLSVVYSGSNSFMSSKLTNIPLNISEDEDCSLSINEPSQAVTIGSTITLKASINSSNPINTGKIVFKINGKTVKDDNGKVIYAKVTNSTVSVDYVLPDTFKAKDYSLTAVYIPASGERLNANATLTVVNE